MNTKKIVAGAMMTALVLVTTAFLKIPSPGNGYMHLGDGFIIAGAFLLGPYAAIPAALGSSLADLIAGYGIYAPVTLLIKGLLGLGVGFISLWSKPRTNPQKQGRTGRWFFYVIQAPLVVLCELAFVLGGYFLFELAMFSFEMAVINTGFTLWQCLAGLFIGLVSAKFADKYRSRF